MNQQNWSRRAFLRRTLVLGAGAPVALRFAQAELLGADTPGQSKDSASTSFRSDSKVAIVRCRSYGSEVRGAMAKCFDLLGGIGPLVRNKTVTVKLNLTGTNFAQYLGRPVGETYMTHYATALALGSLLFAAGARRVRYVESNQSKAELPATLALADWD